MPCFSRGPALEMIRLAAGNFMSGSRVRVTTAGLRPESALTHAERDHSAHHEALAPVDLVRRRCGDDDAACGKGSHGNDHDRCGLCIPQKVGSREGHQGPRDCDR